MRVVGEIPHPSCKITIFSWNNRYLIKLELGLLEQTFKINQFDVISEQAVYKLIDEPFISASMKRFDDMQRSLQEALSRAE
jgi:hypothetical protein